jgi:hypothetical protein
VAAARAAWARAAAERVAAATAAAAAMMQSEMPMQFPGVPKMRLTSLLMA